MSHSEQRTYHVISHTHWDREWYLSFPHFRRRLVDLIDRLLTLLDTDPNFEYFHLDGQTIVLEDYLELRPHEAARLQQHIASGRILIGPWYVQNDEVLTSAESTVRNLLRGVRMTKGSDAEPMPIGYVPDQFGHISQLPQILRGFGLATAVMGRGIDMHRRGSAQFVWRGADGSEVLGLGMPNWYNNAQRFPADPNEAWQVLQAVVERAAPLEKTTHFLLMNGVDHFEAQENLSRILADLQGFLKDGRDGVPPGQIVHSTLSQYAQAVLEEIGTDEEQRGQLPVVTGELREGDQHSILAGTLSTRVHLKQTNVRLHTQLERVVEPVHMWRYLVGAGEPDVHTLEHIWKHLIHNHPHDSICGCSIDAVHSDMMARWRVIEDVIEDRVDQDLGVLASLLNLGDLAQDDQILLLYNPGQTERSEWVETVIDIPVGLPGRFALENPAGEPVPITILNQKRTARRSLSPINLPGQVECVSYRVGFWAESLPPLGLAAYRVRVGQRPVELTRTHTLEPVLENEFLRVSIRPNGSVNILDKKSGKQFDECLLLVDRGDAGDSYVFRQVIADEVLTTRHIQAEVAYLVANEDMQRCRVAFEWQLPVSLTADGQSRSSQRVAMPVEMVLSLGRDSRHLDVEVTCDNRAKGHKLSVRFPDASEACGATDGDEKAVWVGSQFDVIRRPVSAGAAFRRDADAQPSWHWLATGDADGGLAVFHEGLHEYEYKPANILLTLLRAVGWISGDAVHAPRDEESAVPGAQVQGKHTFRLALRPFAGPVEERVTELYRDADAWLAGVTTYSYPLDRARWTGGRPWMGHTYFRPDPYGDLPRLPERFSGLCLSGDGVVLSAVKPPDRWLTAEHSQEGAARCLVVRCFNCTDQSTEAVFSLPHRQIQEAWQLNLAEERLASLTVAEGGELRLPLRAKEIATVELVFA